MSTALDGGFADTPKSRFTRILLDGRDEARIFGKIILYVLECTVGQMHLLLSFFFFFERQMP